MRNMDKTFSMALVPSTNFPGRINRWTGAMPRLVLAPALVLSLSALAGCNNSPSGSADHAALEASNKAARIVASAGAFRPQKNFPGQLSTPIKNQTQLQSYISAHVRGAGRHPASFLMPRSTSRDFRHAAALISAALASPDLHYQFKGLLEAQAGFIALGDAQRSLVKMERSVEQVRAAVDDVNTLALTIAGRNATMQALGTGADMVRQFRTALAAAQTARSAAQANLAAAQAKADKLTADITALQHQRSTLDARGTLLENQSRQTTGSGSLQSFQQAVGLLNKGAVIGEKLAILKGRLDFAQTDVQAATLRLHAATAKTQQLAAALSTAKVLDQKQASRLAAIKADITTLIAGKNAGLQTLNRRLAALQLHWKVMLSHGDAAVKSAQLAQRHLAAAASEQSKNRSEASQLQQAGMSAYNPLVEAKSNTIPECLLDINQGLAELYQAQAYALRLTAITSRLQAQTDAGKAYATINLTSPLPVINNATEAGLKTKATQALLQALSVLGQARSLYPSGTSPVKWLTPAVQTMVYLQLARLASDNAQRMQQLAKAAQAAADAHRHNPFLILPKIPSAQ